MSELRILNVEDSESDAAQVLRELEKAGYQTTFRRVDTEKDLRDCLKDQDWDLIVADFSLPGFDALGALNVVHEMGRDIPFIVFSGQIGEDRAIDLMKSGAHDYVLKSNMSRLLPAVARELKEAQVRKERRKAELALQDSEARYRAIVETNTDMICRFLKDGRLTFVNLAYCQYFEKTKEELVGRVFSIVVPDEDRKVIKQMMEALQKKQLSYTHEHRVIKGQGEIRWNQWTNSVILDDRGRFMEYQAVGRDITERKNAENELSRLTGELLRTQDEERRRLARELHDTTAQKVSALSLNLNYVLSHAQVLPDKAKNALHEALNLADSCTQEIRTFSYLLHPPELDLLGLRGAINDFVNGFSRRSGIEVHFEVSPTFERASEEVETALFRIVQESLTNVHRHSGSDVAWVRLSREASHILLEIKDQGQGFTDPQSLKDLSSSSQSALGVGIAGMRERLRRLKGHLNIVSNSAGTTIQATVPG